MGGGWVRAGAAVWVGGAGRGGVRWRGGGWAEGGGEEGGGRVGGGEARVRACCGEGSKSEDVLW